MAGGGVTINSVTFNPLKTIFTVNPDEYEDAGSITINCAGTPDSSIHVSGISSSDTSIADVITNSLSRTVSGNNVITDFKVRPNSAGTVTLTAAAFDNVNLRDVTGTLEITVTTAAVEDESYLNKRGLTHFWENIDDIKQDKLTAGTGISITGNTISATGGGTADAVDWGHITGTMSNQTDLTTALNAKANSADLATVATSGSYNDLSNKPTIPTVNNATLTIQKNGTNVQTFTANQGTNATANIVVPTKTSDLTNDSGFLDSVAWGDVTGKPTFATVATSGSYNDLSNKPTIPAAQVQSNWTQTTTTAVDYIKNKPALATVATSGSYNDLNNKPTIPTVNNATLTIQKNGTNVQTFTANQSTNATANITVPTKTSELTNDSSFVTSSGTVDKANQLTTPRTIAISGGATGTATSFSGASNISIPVTDVKDAYVTWGGKVLNGNVTPDDMGCIDEFGHNKLAFLPAECINVAYSTNGGSTWTDYGATNAQKVRFVSTTGTGFLCGGPSATATADNIANLRLRIRIAAQTPAAVQKIYTSVRKLLFNVSTSGAGNCKVQFRTRTIANYLSSTETWNTVGTYTVSGYSGWNSIPWQANFGGSTTSQTGQIGELEFIFWSETYGSSGTRKLNIIDMRLIGATNWATPSEMARAGSLFTIDENQSAYFPANVRVAGSLQHGSYSYTLPNKNGTVAMTSDIPSVPTVNNGQLTIQKNGSSVATFTANQSGNATANITVPTTVAELSDAGNYATNTALDDKQDILTAGSHISISNDTISATGYVHSENPVTAASSTATVTGSMIANGTITSDKLAAGATLKLTLSTTDIGEGAALAANTLYGVYQ